MTNSRRPHLRHCAALATAAAAALIGLCGCGPVATAISDTSSPTVHVRTIVNVDDVNVYAYCDASTGNLLYITQPSENGAGSVAAVAGGCAKAAKP